MLDYESFSETITFVVGDTVGDRECINVQISADDETEIDEDFFVYTLIISNSPQEIEIEISQFLKRITIIDGEYMCINKYRVAAIVFHSNVNITEAIVI